MTEDFILLQMFDVSNYIDCNCLLNTLCHWLYKITDLMNPTKQLFADSKWCCRANHCCILGQQGRVEWLTCGPIVTDVDIRLAIGPSVDRDKVRLGSQHRVQLNVDDVISGTEIGMVYGQRNWPMILYVDHWVAFTTKTKLGWVLNNWEI